MLPQQADLHVFVRILIVLSVLTRLHPLRRQDNDTTIPDFLSPPGYSARSVDRDILRESAWILTTLSTSSYVPGNVVSSGRQCWSPLIMVIDNVQ